MKHTKGNWIAHDGQVYPEETGKTLALIPYWDAKDEEQKANAELMSKAPEILKALDVLLSSYKADFKTITGANLNKTEAVKMAEQVLNELK